MLKATFGSNGFSKLEIPEIFFTSLLSMMLLLKSFLSLLWVSETFFSNILCTEEGVYIHEIICVSINNSTPLRLFDKLYALLLGFIIIVKPQIYFKRFLNKNILPHAYGIYHHRGTGSQTFFTSWRHFWLAYP